MLADAEVFLKDAAQRDRDNLVRLSIRELLQRWGHKRRGYWVVNQIEQDLEAAGLTTNPPFTQGWIDATVELVPKDLVEPEDATGQGGNGARPLDESGAEPGEVTILVGSLRSAGHGVCHVMADSTLLQAQS